MTTVRVPLSRRERKAVAGLVAFVAVLTAAGLLGALLYWLLVIETPGAPAAILDRLIGGALPGFVLGAGLALVPALIVGWLVYAIYPVQGPLPSNTPLTGPALPPIEEHS